MVDRFDLTPCEGESGRCLADFDPSDDGEWVMYEDYRALESKLDARTKLVQAMMARLADLLDDDHFNNMEAMVLDAGVPYPDEEPPK